MRRTLVTIVCCLAVAGLAGVAGAATNQNKAPVKSQSAKPEASTTQKAPMKSQSAKPAVKKAKHERLWGKVTAIDTKAMTITIHNKKKGDHTVSLNSKTKLREGKTDIKLDKIKVGSHVGIFYELNGKSMVATSVHLHVKKAKTPKTKTTAKSGR